MKYFLSLFRDYFKENYNSKLYGATLLWVAFLVTINFSFEVEDDFIDSFKNGYVRSILYFLYQATTYYVSCFFIYQFTKHKNFLTNKRFWIISLIGFLILGLSRGNYFAQDIVYAIDLELSAFNYTYKIVIRVLKITLVIAPLYILYYFGQRSTVNHFYGLRTKANLKPYFLLLLLMVPIIYIASLSPSFLSNYPRYQSTSYLPFALSYQVSSQLLIGIYEVLYGLGFVAVELFFRGFLIFGLTRFLGPQVVLPMAVTYCVLHFGKPLGEAISSFFGGYILGVIALKTENIYGGIFVHVGIAWLMELFAWWQCS